MVYNRLSIINGQRGTGRILVGVLVGVVMLASACSSGRGTTRQEGVRIVVLGSSTAEGAGPSDPANTWVNRYRAHLREQNPAHEVLNLAKGGYTTYHIQPSEFESPAERPSPDVARNITKALELEPDAVLINLPSNDATNGYTIEEQMANYARVMDAAQVAGVSVWITTTQPRNLGVEGRDNLRAMRDRTFSTYGDRAIDFWTDQATREGEIRTEYDSGDGIHLNDAAHANLFRRVMEARIPEAVRTAGR